MYIVQSVHTWPQSQTDHSALTHRRARTSTVRSTRITSFLPCIPLAHTQAFAARPQITHGREQARHVAVSERIAISSSHSAQPEYSFSGDDARRCRAHGNRFTVHIFLLCSRARSSNSALLRERFTSSHNDRTITFGWVAWRAWMVLLRRRRRQTDRPLQRQTINQRNTRKSNKTLIVATTNQYGERTSANLSHCAMYIFIAIRGVVVVVVVASCT